VQYTVVAGLCQGCYTSGRNRSDFFVMYLKSIEIHGFKSFANKTELTFLPPTKDTNSITAVVGPNGSGKSNVSDAIKWVMGEQKMSQLRGKKSEDIIFSGSASKGKMGMASVMMTLDNRDGRAAIDYEELVIGRRLYRSGESEYLINGNTVRLLDLQLLLAKAQFGQGSYAIIGQGMIDRLLLQSSSDRKSFFDEAAGIKEFQIKRHQAFLRLNRTREHVNQADLLLQEISPRLKTLSRQVKKLEERKEVEIELRESQESYYATLFSHYSVKLAAVETEAGTVGEALQESQGALEKIQAELATLATQSSRQEIFAQLQQEYVFAQQEKNAKERERAVLQGKMQTEYAKSGNHQMGWLESKVEELRTKQAQFDHDISGLESQKATLDKDIEVMRRSLEDIGVKRTTLRSEISSLESNLIRLKSEQSAFTVTGFRAVQAVLEARRELPGVHGVVAQLGRVAKEHHMALDVAAGGRLASIVVDDQECARKGVQFLREGRFGVATFLPLEKVRGREVPQFVYNFLDEDGVVGLAADLVDYDAQYEEIFYFVFGSTIVVEDFETAKRIGVGRVRMVTLKGDMFETSGAIKGGHRASRQHGISFADTSAATSGVQHGKECEDAIAQKQQALEETEIGQEQIRTNKSANENKRDMLINRIELTAEQKHAVDTELAGMEQEIAMQTMSPEQLGDVMKGIGQQKELLGEALSELEEKMTALESQIASFNDEEEEKKQRVFALQDQMQERQRVVNGLVQQKNSGQVERAKLDTKIEDLQHEAYQEIRVALETLLEKGTPVQDVTAAEGLQQKVQKLKYKLSLIGGIDTDVIEEYEQTKERHEGLTGQLTDLNKAMKDLDTLVEELDGIMKRKRAKAFKNIRKEFSRYFEILFDGGKADLIEIYGDESAHDSEDALEEDEVEKPAHKAKKILKGIDVTACPPGKKIKNLQALSGGERTMTSIALMCAILKTNPSPFVVLDEVEAALDEANTLRVVNIVKELSSQSQFVIITHNRVTMHAADALYGVTMGNDGMSKLISVKMGE
jgi:chromosome segregation protein